MKKDFLKVSDFSKDEIEEIFCGADFLRKSLKSDNPVKPLAGKTLGMIFKKPSTRTRISFEAGMFQLGGHALFLESRNLQIDRGETTEDSARIFSSYLDGILIRTFHQEEVEVLAKYSTIPIINALTDLHHPCQIISDLYTIREVKGSLKNIKIAYIGDGNNMLNSLLEGCAIFGMNLSFACPEGYEPVEEILAQSKELAGKRGGDISLFRSPHEAAKEADILYTDIWTSMGQEEEKERREKAFKGFQINQTILDVADKRASVMHCLPAHRGEEITDDVMKSEQSIIFQQAENRLHVQKAILVMLMGEAVWKKKKIKK